MAAAEQLHKPLWSTAGLLETSPLESDAQCDVCVVGAGVAGLLTAERLMDLGLRVIVLDAGPVAGAESCRTTCHLSNALDDRYMEVERVHGAHGARLAAASHTAAIGYLEALVSRLGIDCGWKRVDGYLTVPERHASEQGELLDAELDAARRAGVMVERAPQPPAPWPAAVGAALRFPGQAQAHPVRLLNGVARHLISRGVRVCTGTRVSRMQGGSQAAVETERGPVVRCGHVVVATNTPFNNLVAVHTKQSGYQTYVIALRVPPGILPPLLLWDGLWKDDASYHYLRLHTPDVVTENGIAAGALELLIVGGEDHKTGQGPEGDAPFRRLEDWTRARFPMAGPVEGRWSGEVMEPADGLAYIGHNAAGHRNVYIVTGDSGNGMTHGAIAAMLVPDEILGKNNPWATLYDPSRKPGLHALGRYARENLNTLAQYGDWLRRGDFRREADIPPCEGGVVAHGLKRLAVYKDDRGACTRLSAVCTHLGGVVRWNAQEKTWDCPCHGSRFDREGRVLHGPAHADLKPEGDSDGVDRPAPVERETPAQPHRIAPAL